MRHVQQAKAAPGQLGEVLDFLRLLWAIQHLLKSTSKRMQRSLGVTGPQRLVIRMVEQFPGIGPAELSELLHLHPSTMTVVLGHLERRRLIVRQPDPQDGRRARLHPVPGVLDVRRAPTIEAAVQKAFDAVKPMQVRHAGEVLDALVTALEEHKEDHINRANARAARNRPRPARRSTSAGRSKERSPARQRKA